MGLRSLFAVFVIVSMLYVVAGDTIATALLAVVYMLYATGDTQKYDIETDTIAEVIPTMVSTVKDLQKSQEAFITWSNDWDERYKKVLQRTYAGAAVVGISVITSIYPLFVEDSGMGINMFTLWCFVLGMGEVAAAGVAAQNLVLSSAMVRKILTRQLLVLKKAAE
jgi:hypothetical protein